MLHSRKNTVCTVTHCRNEFVKIRCEIRKLEFPHIAKQKYLYINVYIFTKEDSSTY